MTTLLNIAKMTVSGTPGTGNITLNSAVTGWQSFASAGATNGMAVSFNAVDGSNQQDGAATYSTTGPSLTSISITDSTTGSPLSLTSAAIVSLTARAQDIVNKTGDTLTGTLNWAAAQTIASATTTNIGAATSNDVIISGTTTITGLGTIAAGAARWVQFTGILTLTNGAAIILPGGANITTAAGDTALFISEGSGNWRCHVYQKASGQAVVAPASSPVLLATLALSGTAVTDTTHINSIYNTYYLVFENCTISTAGSKWSIQFSVNGGTSYLTTGYLNDPSIASSPITYGAIAILNSTSHQEYVSASPVANGFSGQLLLSNPNGAPTGGGTQVSGFMSGYTGVTFVPLIVAFTTPIASAVNAIKFTTVAGTATIGGTIKIYGVP